MKSDTLKLCVSLAVFFLLLICVQKISPHFIFNRTSFETPVHLSAGLRSTLVPWLNFDGRNYLEIVHTGYHKKGEMELAVFFPLYPLLTRLLSFDLILNPIYIGLLISAIFLLLSIVLFYKLVLDPKPIFLLLAFPTSFFFLAYYTESFFLFLSLMFFHALHRKKIWLAVLICAFATATKITGVALIPPLVFVAFQKYRKTGRISYELLFAPSGLLAYLFFTHINSGNWFLVFSGQSFWARKFSLLNPLTSFLEWSGKVLAGPLPVYDSPFVYPGIVIEFLTLLFLLYLAIKMYKRIETAQYLYVLTSLLLVLLAGNFSSIHRYALIMFPIFTYLSRTFSRRQFILYLSLCLILLTYLTALFTNGYWSG